MNIWLINHYAGSPEYGMEYRPYYLGRAWQRRGHQVRIVAASHSHVRSRQPQLVANYTQEVLDGLEYVWLRTPPYQGNGLARVANMAAFVGRLFTHSAALMQDFCPDAVIASSTYPLDIFPAWRIARRNQAQLIFEVHDLWPLSPMELGNMSRWHPFIMIMQGAENFAYRHADKVVSMLPKAEPHMRAHGLMPGKFVYVPNGVDTSEWSSAPELLPVLLQNRLNELRASGVFIMCYAGGHAISNALDILLDTAAQTLGKPIHYILVGNGIEKARLQHMAQMKRLSNLEFWDPIPKKAVPALLAQADALFIGWKMQALYRFGVSPNKLMDYMMAARPVIHAIEAGNDLVAEAGCGLSIPPEDPAAVAEAIQRLLRLSPQERAELGERGRRYVLAHHDYEVLAERFLKALEMDDETANSAHRP